MNLADYVELCKEYEREPSDELFQRIVKEAQAIPLTRSEVSSLVGFTQESIAQWESGSASPTAAVREQVVRDLKLKAMQEKTAQQKAARKRWSWWWW